MGAVRDPERLAAYQPAQQRERGIGQIIERQDKRGRGMVLSRQLQQTPAEQQADRQAADVAEKDRRDRTVERRKTDHRAAKRRGNDRGRQWKLAGKAEQRHRGRDGHDLGCGHPVEPVHEVDEVDEPEAGEHQQAAFDSDRQERRDAKIACPGQYDGADRDCLEQ